MAIFARLKRGIIESPKYGKFIYPGEKYVEIDERYRSMIERDDRIEFLEQKQMNEIIENEQQLIEDIVQGQWRQSEKRINQINNIDLLKKIEVATKNADKGKLNQITKDRIDELS